MRYAVYQVAQAEGAPLSVGAVRGVKQLAGETSARLLKFGNRILLCAAPDAPLLVPAPSESLRVEREASLEDVPIDNLHLVTQEGRQFQQRHPDVPVLHDAGRFLVVLISPHRAAEIGASGEASFQVTPVTADDVVFEECPSPQKRPSSDPNIERLVKRLSHLCVKADITTLATYPTRNSLTRYHKDAAVWAAGRLADMGYRTQLWGFDLASSNEFPAGRSLNVVADKNGTHAESRALVLVAAHLDSVNHKDAGVLAPAPGADDNGSGSAGVLEIARVFKDITINHDLRFVLFGGEEEGLLGSRKYVESMAAQERKRIVMVLNMDMIAVDNKTDTPPTVLLEGGPISSSLIDELCSAAHIYTNLKVYRTLKPWGSDHVPFLNAGIPAVLTIEGYDTSNHRIHSAEDILDYVDTKLALEILRMNAAVIASKVGVPSAGVTNPSSRNGA